MHDVLQLEGHDLFCEMLCKNPSMQLIRNLCCLKPFSIFQLMIYNRRSKKMKDFYVTIYLFLHKFVSFTVLELIGKTMTGLREGSRTASTSKMELFVIIVNSYHKELYLNSYHNELYLGCCSSPRSASRSAVFLIYQQVSIDQENFLP